MAKPASTVVTCTATNAPADEAGQACLGGAGGRARDEAEALIKTEEVRNPSSIVTNKGKKEHFGLYAQD